MAAKSLFIYGFREAASNSAKLKNAHFFIKLNMFTVSACIGTILKKLIMQLLRNIIQVNIYEVLRLVCAQPADLLHCMLSRFALRSDPKMYV